MITPNPRGFPRQSLEATIGESLALGTVRASHWSFDESLRTRPPRKVKPPGTIVVVNEDSIAAAMRLLLAGASA